MLVDTHAHLDFPDFAKDLSSVLKRAKEAGVEKIINVGSFFQDNNIFTAVGLHPHEANSPNLEKEVKELKELAQQEKVVAIGECGLDYYSPGNELTDETKEKQKKLFRQQLELAKEKKKPVIFHVRDAHQDSLEIIKDFPNLAGVFHCFSGNEIFLKEVLGLGFYVGVDGNVTFKNASDLQAVIRLVPLNRLLLETDSPFLSPEPYRGTRNEPARVVDILRFLATLRNEPEQLIESATTQNAHALFGME